MKQFSSSLTLFQDQIYTLSMAAKDIIHDAVKSALIKDGWSITHDPYVIRHDDELLYADLAAERPIAAVRGDARIVVEVKSFVGYSIIQDFKEALGQYILYLDILAKTAPEYKLYLAVSDIVYTEDLNRSTIRLILEQREIPLILVDVATEEIVQWIQ